MYIYSFTISHMHKYDEYSIRHRHPHCRYPQHEMLSSNSVWSQAGEPVLQTLHDQNSITIGLLLLRVISGTVYILRFVRPIRIAHPLFSLRFGVALPHTPGNERS